MLISSRCFNHKRLEFAAVLFIIIGILSTPPAAALDELVIGVFPRRNPAVTIQLFKPLAAHLEEKLGVGVRLETAPNFSAFERMLNSRRFHLVHLNQYQYIQAHDRLGYDALLQNEEFGQKTIKGALYTRKDSGIKSIKDLQGRTILFGGGKDAMMSYLVPTYLLRKAGLMPGDYQEKFAISPPNAVLAVYLGHADAAGAGDMVAQLPMVADKIDTNELMQLAVSDELPQLPWAVKQGLSDSVKDKIRYEMMLFSHSEQGVRILQQAQLTGFNPVSDSDYDPIRTIMHKISGHH
jgi:phosphonate transport system substrate-binding protein